MQARSYFIVLIPFNHSYLEDFSCFKTVKYSALIWSREFTLQALLSVTLSHLPTLMRQNRKTFEISENSELGTCVLLHFLARIVTKSSYDSSASALI